MSERYAQINLHWVVRPERHEWVAEMTITVNGKDPQTFRKNFPTKEEADLKVNEMRTIVLEEHRRMSEKN